MSYFFTNNKLIFVIVRCDGDPILLKQIFVKNSIAISHYSSAIASADSFDRYYIDYPTIGFCTIVLALALTHSHYVGL